MLGSGSVRRYARLTEMGDHREEAAVKSCRLFQKRAS